MFFHKKTTENKEREEGVATPEVPFIQRVLLVVDGSQPALDAANFAVNFAQQIRCQISAAYVVDTATLDYLQQMRIFVSEERMDLEYDLEQKGNRYLASVAEAGKQRGLEVETFLRRGRFNQVILNLARELETDLIIIGGWNNGIKQKDSSSVERQLILDSAECPVIVVKKKA